MPYMCQHPRLVMAAPSLSPSCSASNCPKTICVSQSIPNQPKYKHQPPLFPSAAGKWQCRRHKYGCGNVNQDNNRTLSVNILHFMSSCPCPVVITGFQRGPPWFRCSLDRGNGWPVFKLTAIRVFWGEGSWFLSLASAYAVRCGDLSPPWQAAARQSFSTYIQSPCFCELTGWK